MAEKSINTMLCLRQHFFQKDGGMFITAEQAMDDGYVLHGKQNKNRGTKCKHKRKIARASRKWNRG